MNILTSKFWVVFTTLMSAILAFFAPINPLFWVITALVIVDLITAIWRSWKKAPECKGVLAKMRMVKSNKIRRSTAKWFCYIAFVGLCFLVDYVITGGVLRLPKICMGLISLSEMYSIAENMDAITEKNVFMRVFNSVKNPLVNFLDKKMSDENKTNK